MGIASSLLDTWVENRRHDPVKVRSDRGSSVGGKMADTTVEELKKALLGCTVAELAAMAEVINKVIRIKAKGQEAEIERLKNSS